MSISNLVKDAANSRWDEARARKWYEGVAWPVGCNFLPSGSINQLEMWQAETFNPEEIDRELGWLAAIGMNTARVFLHDLLWKQDAKGFLSRIDQFLAIADKHGMRIMLVFFDSCWNPYPVLGPQRAPTPGVHNSYWAQSPGVEIVTNPDAFSRLEDYMTGVMSHFRNDPRILIWDLWNEPGNINASSFPVKDLTTTRKHEVILPLLAKTFSWARSANVSQPITCGVWDGDYAEEGGATPLTDLQFGASDIISFHTYSKLPKVRTQVAALNPYNRPIICSEYMARGTGSTFETILPYFKENKIGAYNWGAVAGKSQTNYPWDSWEKPYASEPTFWHHDIFRRDGSPYDPTETALIKSLVRG